MSCVIALEIDEAAHAALVALPAESNATGQKQGAGEFSASVATPKL